MSISMDAEVQNLTCNAYDQIHIHCAISKIRVSESSLDEGCSISVNDAKSVYLQFTRSKSSNAPYKLSVIRV